MNVVAMVIQPTYSMHQAPSLMYTLRTCARLRTDVQEAIGADEDDVSDVEFVIEDEDEDEDMVEDDSEMETDDDEEESGIGEVHPHVTAQLIMRLQQCKHSPLYTQINGLSIDLQLLSCKTMISNFRTMFCPAMPSLNGHFQVSLVSASAFC